MRLEALKEEYTRIYDFLLSEKQHAVKLNKSLAIIAGELHDLPKQELISKLLLSYAALNLGIKYHCIEASLDIKDDIWSFLLKLQNEQNIPAEYDDYGDFFKSIGLFVYFITKLNGNILYTDQEFDEDFLFNLQSSAPLSLEEKIKLIKSIQLDTDLRNFYMAHGALIDTDNNDVIIHVGYAHTYGIKNLLKEVNKCVIIDVTACKFGSLSIEEKDKSYYAAGFIVPFSKIAPEYADDIDSPNYSVNLEKIFFNKLDQDLDIFKIFTEFTEAFNKSELLKITLSSDDKQSLDKKIYGGSICTSTPLTLLYGMKEKEAQLPLRGKVIRSPAKLALPSP